MAFRLFNKDEQKEVNDVFYQMALSKILENAHLLDKLDDYHRMRDENNNGWNVFYFGFANYESIKKNAYVEMIVKGRNTGDRIVFTKEDTQKIIDKMRAGSKDNCAIKMF